MIQMKCSLCVTIFSVINHKNRNLAIQGIPAPHRDRFEVKYPKIIIFGVASYFANFGALGVK